MKKVVLGSTEVLWDARVGPTTLWHCEGFEVGERGEKRAGIAFEPCQAIMV